MGLSCDPSAVALVPVLSTSEQGICASEAPIRGQRPPLLPRARVVLGIRVAVTLPMLTQRETLGGIMRRHRTKLMFELVFRVGGCCQNIGVTAEVGLR